MQKDPQKRGRSFGFDPYILTGEKNHEFTQNCCVDGRFRSREFGADATGAQISGHPLSLASALRKLSLRVQQHPLAATPSRNATAHMFIVNPFSASGLAALFHTHPSTEERIARLQDMARHM